MPSAGQCCSAASTASWTRSSAVAKSPVTRISAVASWPACCRTTLASCSCAASVTSLQRADLHERAAGPGLDHAQRLVQIGDLNLGVPADHLLALHERTVGDDWL